MKSIRVMISSRCSDQISYEGKQQALTIVRRALKTTLEKETLGGKQIFEVWINEDAPPEEGSSDSWEVCLQQVRSADIVIALYNGNAGWAKDAGDVGICHAEYQTALNEAPAKLRTIVLPEASKKILAEPRNERFRQYLEAQSRFVTKVDTGEELINKGRELLHDAVVDMVKLGTREARKGKFYSGAALDWSRLDFATRKLQMEKVARSALLERAGSADVGGFLRIQLFGKDILIALSAIPGATTLAAARELVGQPFTRDHRAAEHLGPRVAGPVHLVVCLKTVTENQARNFIGIPDVTVVSPPFGIFVADNVQKIQALMVANCRDETSTRHGIQRSIEWLEQSGEDRLFVGRAEARARIVKAIAKEIT